MILRALGFLALLGLAAPVPAQDAPKPGPAANPAADRDVGTPPPPAGKPDAKPVEKPADKEKDKPSPPSKSQPQDSVKATPKSWEERVASVSILKEGNTRAQPVEAGPPPAAAAPAQAPGKVFAPFLPKPLEPVPAGWKLGSAEGVKPVPVEARLADGRLLRFTVIPPVLVPGDDGALIVRVPVAALSGEQSLVRHLQDLRASLDNANKRLDDWKTALGAALDAAPTPPLPAAKPAQP